MARSSKNTSPQLAKPAVTSVGEWLAQQAEQDTLRFITCGSVDDGKSTLIGRLLWESQQIFDDQLAALSTDSKRHGTQGEQIDLALLVDGFDPELVRRVISLVDKAEYKRRQYPPGTKVSVRAFGKDRRLPMTSGWNEQ